MCSLEISRLREALDTSISHTLTRGGLCSTAVHPAFLSGPRAVKIFLKFFACGGGWGYLRQFWGPTCRSARGCKRLFIRKSIKEIRHVSGGECALSLILSTLTRGGGGYSAGYSPRFSASMEMTFEGVLPRTASPISARWSTCSAVRWSKIWRRTSFTWPGATS